VADFIGRANLIKSRLWPRRRTAPWWIPVWGRFACHRRDYPVGKDLILCIRPEFMILDPDESRTAVKAGTFNLIQGVVETMIFVGDSYEGEIRAGGRCWP
jgi:iron(III) transport system ATP-binding protein